MPLILRRARDFRSTPGNPDDYDALSGRARSLHQSRCQTVRLHQGKVHQRRLKRRRISQM
jgi:hypothetical protein